MSNYLTLFPLLTSCPELVSLDLLYGVEFPTHNPRDAYPSFALRIHSDNKYRLLYS